MMSKNVLAAAALDGARIASLPATTESTPVIAAIEDRLSRAGMEPEFVTVSLSPSNLQDLETGDEITVMLTFPIDEMSWGIALKTSSLARTQVSALRE